MAVIGGSLTRLRTQRSLVLGPERHEAAEVVYVRVDDGLPGGFPTESHEAVRAADRIRLGSHAYPLIRETPDTTAPGHGRSGSEQLG